MEEEPAITILNRQRSKNCGMPGFKKLLGGFPDSSMLTGESGFHPAVGVATSYGGDLPGAK
jgi:hypothetical protein